MSLSQKLSSLQSRIQAHNNLPQVEQQIINQINRNNLRLDQIIEAVKKLIKTSDVRGGNHKKNGHVNVSGSGNIGNFNSMADHLQPKKLKDRVQRMLVTGGQTGKYIKG